MNKRRRWIIGVGVSLVTLTAYLPNDKVIPPTTSKKGQPHKQKPNPSYPVRATIPSSSVGLQPLTPPQKDTSDVALTYRWWYFPPHWGAKEWTFLAGIVVITVITTLSIYHYVIGLGYQKSLSKAHMLRKESAQNLHRKQTHQQRACPADVSQTTTVNQPDLHPQKAEQDNLIPYQAQEKYWQQEADCLNEVKKELIKLLVYRKRAKNEITHNLRTLTQQISEECKGMLMVLNALQKHWEKLVEIYGNMSSAQEENFYNQMIQHNNIIVKIYTGLQAKCDANESIPFTGISRKNKLMAKAYDKIAEVYQNMQKTYKRKIQEEKEELELHKKNIEHHSQLLKQQQQRLQLYEASLKNYEQDKGEVYSQHQAKIVQCTENISQIANRITKSGNEIKTSEQLMLLARKKQTIYRERITLYTDIANQFYSIKAVYESTQEAYRNTFGHSFTTDNLYKHTSTKSLGSAKRSRRSRTYKHAGLVKNTLQHTNRTRSASTRRLKNTGQPKLKNRNAQSPKPENRSRRSRTLNAAKIPQNKSLQDEALRPSLTRTFSNDEPTHLKNRNTQSPVPKRRRSRPSSNALRQRKSPNPMKNHASYSTIPISNTRPQRSATLGNPNFKNFTKYNPITAVKLANIKAVSDKKIDEITK